MPRGNHRNHSVKGNARRRLLKGETHGMAVRLSDRSLSFRPLSFRDDASVIYTVNFATLQRMIADDGDVYLVPIAALERLAAFLGVADPAQATPSEPEKQRRHTLARAIQREENRLSKCPRAERWNESPNRRRPEMAEETDVRQPV